MSRVMVPSAGELQIPLWVNDLASFRRWADSGALPEKQQVHFIDGRVWVDLSMEELNSHNRVKTALIVALVQLIEGSDLGIVICDGMRYTSEAGDFSTEPDAVFLSHAALAAGRVRFEAGRLGQATEMVGTPDLAIEIVSRTSVEKDTQWLFSQYWYAGIPEYWLIDARASDIEFDIYRRTTGGYTATGKASGWVSSATLGKEFRLIRGATRGTISCYRLENR